MSLNNLVPIEIIENPFLLAFAIAVLRNVLGYIEMKFHGTSGDYDIKKFGETLALYEGVFLPLSMIPEMPTVVISIIAIVVDVLRSMKKAIGDKK